MPINLGKNFWNFRIGQIISLLGDQIAMIAIAFYVLNNFGLVANLSLVLTPGTIVGLLLTLILSPYADHYAKKPFLICGNFIKAVAWLLLFILLLQHKLTILIMSSLYVVNFIGAAIINAGISGFLPELVSRKKFTHALRIILGGNSLVKVIGGIFAGVIVALIGIPAAILLNAITFFYVFISLFFLKVKRIFNKNTQSLFNLWRVEFFNGWFFLARNTQVNILIVVLFVIQVILAPLQIALPDLVKNILHESPRFLGLLLSAEGVGAILAVTFISNFRQNSFVLYNCFLAAVSTFLLGLQFPKFIYCLLVILLSFGMTNIIMVINSELLQIIPKQLRSRVFAIILFVEGVGAIISIFIAGYMIDLLGLANIFFAMGVGLAILGVFLSVCRG